MAEEKPGKKPEKTTPPTKDADGKAAAAPKKKKKSKGGKGKVIAIAAALAVVLIGGGVTAFFLLSGSGKDKGARQATVALPPPPLDPGPMTIYDFPKVLADLKTGECRSSYLSARFMVEVGKNYTKDLQAKQDKIVEGVMLHLRSLERKDLVGKAGSDRMRADLISIINNIAKPAKVEGLVFKEFILQ
jgi:flagellar FliL protein